MKKEEVIAMVGEGNISGWWTKERIIFVVGLTALIVSGYARYILVVQTSITELGVVFGVFVALIYGMRSLNGRVVSTTRLRVEKVRHGSMAEVLGKDGKIHHLGFDRVHFHKQDPTDSFVEVSYRVNDLRVELTATKNLDQVWK